MQDALETTNANSKNLLNKLIIIIVVKLGKKFNSSSIIYNFKTMKNLKTIYIVRHAKSDQNFFEKDFERPLNEQGYKDAQMMAKRLLEKNVKVDAFICSPAKRARSTAKIFAAAFGKIETQILFLDSLYHPPFEEFYKVIQALPDELNNIAIFSHNPGISYFVNSLAGNVKLDHMPTCGIFAIETNILFWKDFSRSNNSFLFFDSPQPI